MNAIALEAVAAMAERTLSIDPNAADIQEALLGPEGPRNLPRKFNVAVGGAPDSFLLHNDLAFLPAHHGGELGFTVMVGGFFSAQRNELAIPLGVWLRGEQLPAFSLAVLRHYEREGSRENRNKTRLMYLIDALGQEDYRSQVLDTFAEFVGVEEAAATPSHDGSHLVSQAPRDICGVHAQKQEGLHWVGLHVPMGRLEAASILELARLAREYGSGELRLSESQPGRASGPSQ